MSAVLFKEPEQFIGCFSPAVPSYLVDLWVNHGGLTASPPEDDCRLVNFFFCAGLKDPWLKQLTTRPLTVLHPKWIAAAISQNFAVLEISAYILNDLVDEGEIPSLDVDRRSLPSRSSGEDSRKRNHAEKLARINSQKRRRSALEFSFSALDRRPNKKARIGSRQKALSLYSAKSSSTTTSASEECVTPVIRDDLPPRLPRRSKQHDPAVLFEKKIIRQSWPASKGLVTSSFSANMSWSSHLRDHLDLARAPVLTPPVLSRAPPPVSVLFDVSKSYRGQAFSCVEAAAWESQ